MTPLSLFIDIDYIYIGLRPFEEVSVGETFGERISPLKRTHKYFITPP
jgi:hypothetical protein